jgi:hypothetical protein
MLRSTPPSRNARPVGKTKVGRVACDQFGAHQDGERNAVGARLVLQVDGHRRAGPHAAAPGYRGLLVAADAPRRRVIDCRGQVVAHGFAAFELRERLRGAALAAERPSVRRGVVTPSALSLRLAQLSH